MNELVRSLAAKLPSLAVKTGWAEKGTLGAKASSTLEVAVDSAMSGTPTLFLDVRERPRLSLDAGHATDRAALIAAGQRELEKAMNEMIATGA